MRKLKNKHHSYYKQSWAKFGGSQIQIHDDDIDMINYRYIKVYMYMHENQLA